MRRQRHVRLALAPGGRRPSVVAESYEARVHYGHCPHRSRTRLPRRRKSGHLRRRANGGRSFWPHIGPIVKADSKMRGSTTAQKWQLNCTNPGGQGRDRTGDLPLFRRTLIPTELPGRKALPCLAVAATLTGLEPATSAVTGRRANQLRHRALLCDPIVSAAARTPYGIRTRATALKGRRPRPLDEGGQPNLSGVLATR
jgi:hypothetical protein